MCEPAGLCTADEDDRPPHHEVQRPTYETSYSVEQLESGVMEQELDQHCHDFKHSRGASTAALEAYDAGTERSDYACNCFRSISNRLYCTLYVEQ